MTTEPQPGAPGAQANLIERAKSILLQPRAEWDRIAVEPANVQGLYIGYVLPLAALAAIAGAIGLVVFGIDAPFGVHISMDPISGLIGAVVQVITSLIGVAVLGVIINTLAPNFGSQADQNQAHKLAAYSMTASFLASCFAIVPALAMLGILGLYSFVLLYLGLPRLMKTPEDKRVGYFVTILIVGIVIGLLIGVVTSQVRAALPTGGFAGFGGQQQVQRDSNVQLPGGGSVDLGDLQRQAEQMQQQIQQGQSVTLDPAALQALLPAGLPGGFTRSSISRSSDGAAGMNVSEAKAEYTRGADTIQLSIAHMGAARGLATMGAALGVTSERDDVDGYERTNTVDGRTVTEELSRSSQTAKYMVITRTGVAITAEGRGAAVTGDDVRNAVSAIGVERVEALRGTPVAP
jgi:hypothetical protein